MKKIALRILLAVCALPGITITLVVLNEIWSKPAGLIPAGYYIGLAVGVTWTWAAARELFRV